MILFPVIDADGRPLHMVTIFEDLARELEERAARETLEAQLRHAQKMEAIGTLAGGVAHDFNNLLTGVIGYLEMIRTTADPEIDDYARKAERAAQRACDLTRQLLAYARKTRRELIVHDLNHTLSEVAALIEKTIDPRIELQIEVSPEPVAVLADPGQMNQVLMNLCINARDAVLDAMEGGRRVPGWRPQIQIRCAPVVIDAARARRHPDARAGTFNCLSVIDNGVGWTRARERAFLIRFSRRSRSGAARAWGWRRFSASSASMRAGLKF
jgi:two-component system, cell cycle sensor histidine kinase and response regulator CckA